MGSAASGGGQGAAPAAPPSTATPVTGVAPQHPPAPAAAPALPRCLQTHRYGSRSRLDVGALPAHSTQGAAGVGSVTHGWARLSHRPCRGASTGQTALCRDAFPVGFHAFGVLPRTVSAPRSRAGGPSWQAGTPVCKTCLVLQEGTLGRSGWTSPAGQPHGREKCRGAAT